MKEERRSTGDEDKDEDREKGKIKGRKGGQRWGREGETLERLYNPFRENIFH